MHTKKEVVNLGVASVVGSLTNTFLFLGILYLFFANTGANAIVLLIVSAGLINGLCEAVLTLVVCPPIIRALRKSMPSLRPRTAEIKEITQ